jgi:hypothetical protein
MPGSQAPTARYPRPLVGSFRPPSDEKRWCVSRNETYKLQDRNHPSIGRRLPRAGLVCRIPILLLDRTSPKSYIAPPGLCGDASPGGPASMPGSQANTARNPGLLGGFLVLASSPGFFAIFVIRHLPYALHRPPGTVPADGRPEPPACLSDIRLPRRFARLCPMAETVQPAPTTIRDCRRRWWVEPGLGFEFRALDVTIADQAAEHGVGVSGHRPVRIVMPQVAHQIALDHSA